MGSGLPCEETVDGQDVVNKTKMSSPMVIVLAGQTLVFSGLDVTTGSLKRGLARTKIPLQAEWRTRNRNPTLRNKM